MIEMTGLQEYQRIPSIINAQFADLLTEAQLLAFCHLEIFHSGQFRIRNRLLF